MEVWGSRIKLFYTLCMIVDFFTEYQGTQCPPFILILPSAAPRAAGGRG
jgi:hypothetical protein